MTLEQPQEKPRDEELEKLHQQFQASKSTLELSEEDLKALDESDKDDHLYGRK